VADEISVSKPRSRGRRVLRFFLIAAASLVVLMILTTTVLRYSGSNRWEFVGEKKGVKIYSLKTPGTDSKKFKINFRVRSSLAGLVKLMQDPEACADMGCYESRVVQRVDDHLMYNTFRFKLPSPFLPREFVVRTQVYQNPQTKEVLVDYVSALSKLPPNDCCFRVTDMNNSWRMNPVGDGQVDVEYIVNMNEGGFVPDLLLNAARPRVLFIVVPRLQRILNKEKYKTAKLDFIQEK
jgi:hypothetical protein